LRQLLLPPRKAEYCRTALRAIGQAKGPEPLLALAAYLTVPALPSSWPPDFVDSGLKAISVWRAEEEAEELERYASAMRAISALLPGSSGAAILLQAEAETMRFTLAGV
jgi:hypothetical protein